MPPPILTPLFLFLLFWLGPFFVKILTSPTVRPLVVDKYQSRKQSKKRKTGRKERGFFFFFWDTNFTPLHIENDIGITIPVQLSCPL